MGNQCGCLNDSNLEPESIHVEILSHNPSKASLPEVRSSGQLVVQESKKTIENPSNDLKPEYLSFE